MNVHKNARLTAHSRAELVRRVLVGGPAAEGRGHGLRRRRQDGRSKWVGRFRSEGPSWPGRPLFAPEARCAGATPCQTQEQIIALRRERWTGQQIAKETRGLAGDGEPHPKAGQAQPRQGPGARPSPWCATSARSPAR